MLAGIFSESEDSRTLNTNTHTNDEKVQVVDVIDIDSDSDEVLSCDMEDSYFVVGDEYITNFNEE